MPSLATAPYWVRCFSIIAFIISHIRLYQSICWVSYLCLPLGSKFLEEFVFCLTLYPLFLA